MKDITANFRETIDEIAARMKEQKNWPSLDFGTLCAVVGSGLGTWKSIIDQDYKFGVPIALLGLAPTIYSAFRGSNIDLHDKPLAYAAFVRNRLT